VSAAEVGFSETPETVKDATRFLEAVGEAVGAASGPVDAMPDPTTAVTDAVVGAAGAASVEQPAPLTTEADAAARTREPGREETTAEESDHERLAPLPAADIVHHAEAGAQTTISAEPDAVEPERAHPMDR
jgi:hypothetical protein